jgi:phage shock protein PspC (stress-responsive transcriptional regulator)
MSAPSPHPRPLRRSRTDRMIAGVCAGLAHHFGLDVLVYIVLWLVIPEEPAA